MTPLRLLILASLFYIGFRLLRSMLRDQVEKEYKESETHQEETKVQDTLVEDPVCHTLLPKKQAIRLRLDGKTYYFCSEKCCDIFTGASEEQS
ncbi:YHS domain-containing protein [Desulfogranum japonicum]|uniref:YHS domain-containing protein n=1 Tax=Desulfogranum japonicum TaxID=231447 RepID=UPI0003FEF764|nr:YHS domain-containing protein [Desulfogranum japonicum]